MITISLLSSNSYFIYNRNIARVLSPECAILLGLLCSRYIWHKNANQLTMHNGKECFFCTRDTIFDETGLKETAQRVATNKLLASGIIEIQKFGIPPKNYYSINEEKLTEILEIDMLKDLNSSLCMSENETFKDENSSLQRREFKST